MIYQSLRPSRHHHDGSHALVAGMGLLPCPLTISVLGFAWLQSSAVMVAVTLISLASGIAITIGLVAVLAIVGRATIGAALVAYMPALDRSARWIQGLAGVAIVRIAAYTIVSMRR